jgi:membrane protein
MVMQLGIPAQGMCRGVTKWYALAVLPFRILWHALRKFLEDDGLFMSRGLAFGLLVYCIPLGLLTVSALSYTVVSSERALDWVQSLSRALMPGLQRQFSDYLSSIVSNRGLLGLAGFLTFLFVSSTTFGSLRLVLNRVFKASEPRGMIHGKAMEVVMMMATSGLLFIVIALLYGLALVESFFRSLSLFRTLYTAFASQFPTMASYVRPGTVAIVSVLSFGATVGLFWFLYRFSPAKAPGRTSLIVGALTATVLFELSKLAFGWYIGYAHGTAGFYGTLSGFVFFFLWLYYACVVFLLGAEVSWIVENGGS